MPWTAKDAKRFTKKANTPARRKLWARVANAVLRDHEDEGFAIRIANALIRRRVETGQRTKMVESRQDPRAEMISMWEKLLVLRCKTMRVETSGDASFIERVEMIPDRPNGPFAYAALAVRVIQTFRMNPVITKSLLASGMKRHRELSRAMQALSASLQESV